MEINRDINSPNTAFNQSPFTSPPPLKADKKNAPGPLGNDGTKEKQMEAAAVNISPKGRAASITLDFNAAAENLVRLEELRQSNSFSKSYVSISYEKVKALLE